MATYYVVSQDARNETANVIIHFSVPVGQNDAARDWTDIVAELRTFNGQTGVSQVPWADGTMIAALDAGTLYELPFSFQDDGKLGLAARAANLDTAVAARIVEFEGEFANIYRFYGIERTV